MVKREKKRQNTLDVICIPDPGRPWTEEKDGRIVVVMVHRGFFHWMARRFFRRPDVSYIALDDYGSTLWKELDGKQTVCDIITKMKQYFPAEQSQMQERVVAFMDTLARNHFIINVSR